MKIFLLFILLRQMLSQITLICGNNMNEMLDTNKPLPTLVTIISENLIRASSSEKIKSVDMYFSFNMDKKNYNAFRPVHPSNPSLGIYANGIKAEIVEEVVNEQNQTYYFIIKVKDYPTYKDGICDIKFEGAYANQNVVQMKSYFSPDLEQVRKLNATNILFPMTYSQNIVMINGKPTRYTLNGMDSAGKQTSLHQGVIVQPTLYFTFQNIKNIAEYMLIIDVSNTNKLIGLYYDYFLKFWQTDNPVSASDGKWSFTIEYQSINKVNIKNISSILYLYDNYTMALQFPDILCQTYGQSTQGFGIKTSLCKKSPNIDCLFEDGDYHYYPEVQYTGQQSTQDFSIQLLSEMDLGISKEFEFKMQIKQDKFVLKWWIIAFNFPKEITDINQDLFNEGFSMNAKNEMSQKIIRIDNDRYPLPSEYTAQFIIFSINNTNSIFQFRLRAPNREFVTNKLKVFVSSLSFNLQRSMIQEVQTDIQLKFSPKQLPKLEIIPVNSGIRTQGYYQINIGLGYQIHKDAYITIKVPPEVKVRDMPNIQNKKFPSNLDPYCSPFIQIENQLITVTKFICPQYETAITKDVPLLLLVNSIFVNPNSVSTLNFQFDVYSKNAYYLGLYNDNTYYKINTQSFPFLFEFTTFAQPTCLSKVQLKGYICDKLLVTLTSNSGIYSSEEIVLSFPPEIIPSIEYLDNQGTPYLNNLRCQLLSGYLPTSTCTINASSNTITITDTQFSNNIYQLEKSIIIYNTIIPRYMNPLTTDTPPFPNNVIPFSYVVQATDTKIISSSRQIIKKESFYKVLPLNKFSNLDLNMAYDTLNQNQNSIYIKFQAQVQLLRGDKIQIFFPKFFDFTKATLNMIGRAVENQQFQFKPHPLFTNVIMLEITLDRTVTDIAIQNIIIIQNIQNPSIMPNYAQSPITQDYTHLKDSLIQIIDRTSQVEFYQSVVKDCYMLSDSESIKVDSISLIARGRESQFAIYGESLTFRFVISFIRTKSISQQKYLDLFLNIPVLDQQTASQIQININGESYTDFEALTNPDYTNIFRFKNFPLRVSVDKQYYTIELSNIKSKKEIFDNPKNLNVKVQRVLKDSSSSIFELDKAELTSQYSLQCDPSCLRCIDISTFCTACYPEKELHPTIPGKCRATIAVKMISADILPPSQNSLQDYNEDSQNVLYVQKTGDIFIQFQAYFAEVSTYYLEVQIPSIFSISSELTELYYGEDITTVNSEYAINNQNKYEFVSQLSDQRDKLYIRTQLPIELQKTKNHLIKINQIKMPNSSLENHAVGIELLIKDSLDPTQIRYQNTLQRNINIECGSVCKTCEGRTTRCTSCYQGDFFDNLGYLCISKTCWEGQIKIKTTDGFVCVDNDYTQSCQIPYCLYCDTNPVNLKPLCKKCFVNFILSEKKDKCMFKDANTKDDVQINNDQEPFDGKTTDPVEQRNSTAIINNEMDLRELWVNDPTPEVAPNVQLIAPIGIMIPAGLALFSIFSSFAQTNFSFFSDINDKFGLIDFFMVAYYARRLVIIPQFYWWHVYQSIVLFAKVALSVSASIQIFKLFSNELRQVSIYKKIILVFSFRRFNKVVQEQKNLNLLRNKKKKLGNQQRRSSSKTYQSIDPKDLLLEYDEILDHNNPSSLQLDTLNIYYSISVLINLSCIACYLFSKIQYSGLLSVSYEIRTVLAEYLFYKVVVMLSDFSIIIKNIIQMGMHMNLSQPFNYNFKCKSILQNDDLTNNSSTEELKEQQIDLPSYSINQDDEDYEMESSEDNSQRIENNSEMSFNRHIKRRNSWPQQQPETHTGAYEVSVNSLYEKAPLKNRNLGKSDIEDSKDNNEIRVISQFNIAD